MAVDDPNATTTRLLTLLNVSATKTGKRKRNLEEHKPSEKLNKKRAVQIAAPDETTEEVSEASGESEEKSTPLETEQEEGAPGGEEDDAAGACTKRSIPHCYLLKHLNILQAEVRTHTKPTLACSPLD